MREVSQVLAPKHKLPNQEEDDNIVDAAPSTAIEYNDEDDGEDKGEAEDKESKAAVMTPLLLQGGQSIHQERNKNYGSFDYDTFVVKPQEEIYCSFNKRRNIHFTAADFSFPSLTATQQPVTNDEDDTEGVADEDTTMIQLVEKYANNNTGNGDNNIFYSEEDAVLWKLSKRVSKNKHNNSKNSSFLASLLQCFNNRSCKSIQSLLPWLQWIPMLWKNPWLLTDDIASGIIVGIMLVPQGMAYALIAGLPPIIGLYTSFIPILIYGLFGTCRQLSMGPVAMTSLMTASAVAQFAPQSVEEHIAYAALISICVGCIHLLVGALRLGFIVNFISHSVLTGFISAAALVIIAGQCKYVFGISIPNDKQIYMLLYNAFKPSSILQYKWQAIVTSVLCISVLAIFQIDFKLNIKGRLVFSMKKVPSALIVVVSSILAILLFKYTMHVEPSITSKSVQIFDIQVIGTIPAGLPSFAIPKFSLEIIVRVMLASLSIAFISFMESISLALAFGRKNKYDISINQELIALGCANLTGGFFSCYPATGGLSRSAVLATAGAQTQLAGIISSLVIMLTLLLLTPIFYYLPFPALAAIIIVACTKLIDFHEIWYTFKTNKQDFITLLATFISTLVVGIEEGIAIGVAFSIFFILYTLSTPHFSVLGRIPGTQAYRSLTSACVTQSWQKLIITPGVVVARLDSDLMFTNANYFREHIEEMLTIAPTSDKEQVQLSVVHQPFETQVLVLDFSSVSNMDSAGASCMLDVIAYLQQRNILLFIAEVKPSVMQTMQHGGIWKQIQINSHVFPEEHDAIIQAKKKKKKRIQESLKKDEEEIEVVVE